MFLAEASIQLAPDGTIFIHIGLILFMVWVLNRTLFKPINQILAERERNTGGRMTETQELLQKAQTTENQYQNGLREARAEGYATVEQTRAAAVKRRQEYIAELKEETAAGIADEKARLDTQVAAAREQVQTQAEEIARKITSNVLGRSVDA